ncbi:MULTISPECIES: flagellar biosynthetic protein FliQ [Novosphingobium]|jgi:flagellar biosynthetic protein FliQ|uniref:Flagellar biosynthetic protein FliQ n=1 Tax=Novosphingobium panipatense TaxID=428991 RepID=A0ABY1QQJ8_9SPHN|nr:MULTISPECIES: flagellar biosynthetic protein FliQ [Novosphingobium]SMP76259.1 flagellar biosynthetic protein FliQ [Novosphingobium panipatense]
MTPDQAIEVARAALMLMLTISGPMLIAALIVGVLIGLLQALTQVQEMTLTFVPKLLVLGLVMLVSLPMMGHALGAFMDRVADAIIAR